jgi:hypothetical protein
MLVPHTSMNEQVRKITVEVPVRDLESAQRYSGGGVTETVRAALRDYASRQAQADLLKYRGKVRFTLSLEDMKYDD